MYFSIIQQNKQECQPRSSWIWNLSQSYETGKVMKSKQANLMCTLSISQVLHSTATYGFTQPQMDQAL